MEGSSSAQNLPKMLRDTLQHSKSALKQAYNEKLNRKAQKTWKKSPRYDRLNKTDPKAPSNAYIKLITNLPRRLASILTQLRTGHAPLAKHLHRIKKRDSPICPACLQRPETVQHFLLHCPAHKDARQALRNSTGGRNIDIKKLFTRPNMLQALFKYVADTGRFHTNLEAAIPPN